MCLDFPGHVTSRDGDVATVDVDGRLRRASTLLMPDVRVGEWVYVAAGTIVDRLERGRRTTDHHRAAASEGDATMNRATQGILPRPHDRRDQWSGDLPQQLRGQGDDRSRAVHDAQERRGRRSVVRRRVVRGSAPGPAAHGSALVARSRRRRHPGWRCRIPALLHRSCDGERAVGSVHPQDALRLGRTAGRAAPR